MEQNLEMRNRWKLKCHLFSILASALAIQRAKKEAAKIKNN